MIRPITIKPVLNGFIATVGCQEVVFPSLAALVAGVSEFYTDPAGTEKRYRDSAVNKTMIDSVQPQATNYSTLTFASSAANNVVLNQMPQVKSYP